MGQKSSIRRLDPLLRQCVDKALREERATIDEIVAEVQSKGGNVSRSAVGRYAFSVRRQARATDLALERVERDIRVVAELLREILGRLG